MCSTFWRVVKCTAPGLAPILDELQNTRIAWVRKYYHALLLWQRELTLLCLRLLRYDSNGANYRNGRLRQNYEWKELQRQCLQCILKRKDVLLNTPTGYGKLLIFQALSTVLKAGDRPVYHRADSTECDPERPAALAWWVKIEETHHSFSTSSQHAPLNHTIHTSTFRLTL